MGLGHFEKLGSRGPFWTAFSYFNVKECDRLFKFVTKGSETKWTNVRRKYLKDFCVFDKDNKIFFNIVKSVLTE